MNKHLQRKILSHEHDDTLLQLEKVNIYTHRVRLQGHVCMCSGLEDHLFYTTYMYVSKLITQVNAFPLQLQTFIKDLREITNDIRRQETAAVPNQQLLAPFTI